MGAEYRKDVKHNYRLCMSGIRNWMGRGSLLFLHGDNNHSTLMETWAYLKCYQDPFEYLP